jgi:hypothetical protein
MNRPQTAYKNRCAVACHENHLITGFAAGAAGIFSDRHALNRGHMICGTPARSGAVICGVVRCEPRRLYRREDECPYRLRCCRTSEYLRTPSLQTRRRKSHSLIQDRRLRALRSRRLRCLAAAKNRAVVGPSWRQRARGPQGFLRPSNKTVPRQKSRSWRLRILVLSYGPVTLSA